MIYKYGDYIKYTWGVEIRKGMVRTKHDYTDNRYVIESIIKKRNWFGIKITRSELLIIHQNNLSLDLQALRESRLDKLLNSEIRKS